jgi:YD repeat-containing protein
LVSATNPENGTVTYTYDSGHHVLSRTDAIGSKTQYTYDSYGRLSEAQYYPPWSPYNGNTEDTSERVTYYYDNNVPVAYQGDPPPTPQNGIGRLTGVGFAGGVKDSLYDGHYYTYVYSYSAAGRVTSQIS